MIPDRRDSRLSRLLAGYLAVLNITEDEQDAARLVQGQFHDVVLLGEVAYRFPRDEQSRRLLPSRIERLRVLSGTCLRGVIPRLLSDAAALEPLGRCHATFHRLDGHPAGPELVGATSARTAVVSSLAALLGSLRELGGDQQVHQTFPQDDRDRWHHFAGEVRRILYPLMSDDGRARAEQELRAVTAVSATGDSLVHGDLGGANLLWTTVQSRPHLAGVLDWDEACIGNQASDLAAIAVTFGWPAATQISAEQGDEKASPVADARAIAATFALQQALPAALTGDTAMLDDGLTNYRV